MAEKIISETPSCLEYSRLAVVNIQVNWMNDSMKSAIGSHALGSQGL